jgi:hypothetical protein
MQAREMGQVPPRTDGFAKISGYFRGLGGEQNRMVFQVEVPQYFLDFLSQEVGADPKPGSDGSASNPA